MRLNSPIQFVQTSKSINAYYLQQVRFFSRKEWYKLPENLFNQNSDLNQLQEIICCSEQKAEESSTEPNISTELILDCTELDYIIQFFATVQITALNVSDDGAISPEFLVSLINQLPNLNALSVQAISLKETNTSPSTSNHNKITKLNLGNVDELIEVQFLLDLCPLIKYFEIKNWYKIDHKLLVRFILTHKISNTPMLLCITKNVDKTIEELQEMINFEKLTHEYKIKYINEKIYIQLK